MLLSHFKDTPAEARTWRLWFSAWAIGALGISRGLDEGIVSGILRHQSFKHKFHFDEDSDREATIASQVQLGCVAGSIIAFLVCDRLGRLRTTQMACLLWIMGTAIWMTSAGALGNGVGNYQQLLAGRFIAGIGVGFTPVVAPVYLAEIAPKTIRGLCVCIFSGSVYIGILVAYWVNYGTGRDYTDNRQWLIPAALNFIFASITFVASFFAVESPRWLLKKGRAEEARANLVWIRNMGEHHPYVTEEFNIMEEQINYEREVRSSQTWYMALLQLFLNRNNAYILMLGIGIQMLGQFSGGGVFTVFAPKIFSLVGIQGNTSLFTTGIFGIVKLVSSLAAAFFLVDLFGRKISVMTGLGLQAFAAIYLAIYLKLTANITADEETTAQKHAANAAIFFIYLSGFAWAIGVNSVQYLTQTESFDISVRAFGVAFVSVVHFAGQFASSRTLNPMLEAWGPLTFLFYGMVSVATGVFVFLLMPETSGLALEEMKELFDKPWYRIGWTVNRPASRRKRQAQKEIEKATNAELGYTLEPSDALASDEKDDDKIKGSTR
ncbi:general substrate transporter [Violaceomyces palustris]|uniref:General substrate transporter n=1 Tax=Violaceomyces palustris TaxID=1673888 RepID=A0ACD0P554_9BASI|nr:general substrate transporter [Violaceomyces palustris]